MSDLFHARVSDEYICQVFDVMNQTPRHIYQVLTKRPKRLAKLADQLPWPSNVWVGVSVEDRATEWRADALQIVPAAVRFISAEPLLEAIKPDLNGIDWVIAGGESGPNHRPVDGYWLRQLRDDCVRTETAFFFKQWGGIRPKVHGRVLDGRTWDDMPIARERRQALITL